jgi:hypothetical protein
MEVTTKRLILNPISKSIPKNFLRYNITIETIILKEGFTRIEEYAFANCRSLKKIYLPESLKTIGYGAFCRCASLTEIEIPNSVKTVGRDAFYRCENLKEIIIDNTEEFVDKNWAKNWKSNCNAEITYLR